MVLKRQCSFSKKLCVPSHSKVIDNVLKVNTLCKFSLNAQHCEIVQSSLAHNDSQKVLDEFQKLNANQVSYVMIQRSSPTKN